MATVTTFGGGGGTSNNPDGSTTLNQVSGINGPVVARPGIGGFFDELFTIGGRGVLDAAAGFAGQLANGFKAQVAAPPSPVVKQSLAGQVPTIAVILGGVAVLMVAAFALFGGRR